MTCPNCVTIERIFSNKDLFNEKLHASFRDVQEHSGQSFVSISRAIEYFLTKTNKNTAISPLILLYSLSMKSEKDDPEGYEQFGKKILDELIKRFNELPCCFDCEEISVENSNPNA